MNKLITMDEIKYSFEGKRNIIHINKGDNQNVKLFAVPITDEEFNDIFECRNKEKYKFIDMANFNSIGNPNKPTTKLLQSLPFIYVNDISSDKNLKIKSFYYPPLGRPCVEKDLCIVFEDANSLWNYYKKQLTSNSKYNKIAVIEIFKN